MDGDDLEEAIRIAGSKSPTGAFKEAQRYYIRRHGSAVQSGYLGFAKGTRWLAMIHDRSGAAAFETRVSEIRQLCR